MRSPALDRAMSAVTALGEPWALGIAAGAVGLRWLAQDRKADIAAGALGLVGGAAINQVMKAVFRRERPALKLRRAHATGYSFPSGHAMITATSYGVMAYLAGRRGSLTGTRAAHLVLGPVVLLCALVGGSRVYLEVHYLTDVLAGWAAAVVWVTACGMARGFMEPEES